MDRKRQKMTPKKDDVQKECQDRKITALERKLEPMENKLKQITAELEQVKEEQAHDKIDFAAEKCELESKIDKYIEQCTKLQSENEKLHGENIRLQKYLQDLESANINVNKTNDDAWNINALPNEMIVKVFSYLTQNQLGQIARVCRKWNVLAKSPLLWRKVDVEVFCSSDRERNTVVKSFINGLPSCVTFFRFYFSVREDLDFEELCLRLHQYCPHVEELILVRCKISNILPEVIYFCTQFLQGLKKLVFHECDFNTAEHASSTETCLFNKLEDNSKVEVLDLYDCDFSYFCKTQFSKLLNLKELRLNKTFIGDKWFVNSTSFWNQLHVLDLGQTFITDRTFLAIKRHGLNLKELYLCEVDYLTFYNFVFPHLKTICLFSFQITCESVVSLIQSCPSLENVYVNADVATSFAAHPFVVANRCKSEIVKAIDWFHDHNVNYSHN